jgi:opacity protein-like surface antigen
MNKNLCIFVAAILATLFTTSAQAEEVSRKAADLMANASLLPTSKESKSSNLVAQNNEPLINSTDSKSRTSNYFYIGGSVGIASPSDLKSKSDSETVETLGLDSTFQLSIAGGYQWPQARAELEIASSSFGVNKYSISGNSSSAGGNVRATTFMVNRYYDISTRSKFRPYLGAGIGIGSIGGKVKDGSTSVDINGGSSFAYQGKVGVSYEIAKKSNAFAEVKYVGISSYKDRDGLLDIDSPNSFGVSVGYRQGF